MGYGVSLSEQARLSLAGAVKNARTAINSSKGGVLPKELNTAGKYILQFPNTDWTKKRRIDQTCRDD